MEKSNNDELNELIEYKYELMNKLKEVEIKIKKLEDIKIKNCNHSWRTEREDGIYGERYTYCIYCGVNRNW